MRSVDSDLYQIALILSLRSDYEAAANVLDRVHLRCFLQPSGAECTLGTVGLHHVVLATGLENTSVADSVATVFSNLLKEFPSIRAGFLVGVDAIAPHDGPAKAGDIVVGMPQDNESGVVQFDPAKSRAQKRLCITSHWGEPPSFVRSAVNSALSSEGLCAWGEYLDKHLLTTTSLDVSVKSNSAGDQTTFKEGPASPDSPSRPNSILRAPNVLVGRVGSSSQSFHDLELLYSPADKNETLCFERAAANLRGQIPLLVVCGVSKTLTPFRPTESAEDASKIASVYTMFLASRLNFLQLFRGSCLDTMYYHRPFSLERPAFRLLRLERGTGLPIRCSIFEAYLDEPDALLDYEALSYAWGDNAKPEIIIVSGQVLPITESLHLALQHLRDKDVDRILWVDAICIDQSNVAERGHQVASMGNIYEKAESVIIWLGSAGKGAGVLISALTKLQHQVPSQAFRISKRTDADWRDVLEKLQDKPTSDLRFQRRLVYGLNELTGKPWFRRVWILQEVAKAKRAQIHCTAGAVDAKLLFALAPLLLRTEVSQQSQAILDIMPGPSRQSSWWSEERSLRALLWRFRDCEATDPRDRVYALLGIASPMAEDPIEPDYGKTEGQVLQDVCRHFFGQGALADLAYGRNIRTLQENLHDLSEGRIIARWKSLPGLERFLHRHGHTAWAEGIQELACFCLGRSALAFLLPTARGNTPLPTAINSLGTVIGMRTGALNFLLDDATDGTELVLGVIEGSEETLCLIFPNRGPEHDSCESILREAKCSDKKPTVIIDKSWPELRISGEFLDVEATREISPVETRRPTERLAEAKGQHTLTTTVVPDLVTAFRAPTWEFTSIPQSGMLAYSEDLVAAIMDLISPPTISVPGLPTEVTLGMFWGDAMARMRKKL